MDHKAVLGVARSRMAYIRDWGDVAEAADQAWIDEGHQPMPERIFDLSEVLVGRESEEVETNTAVLGRNLPFPALTCVGNGEGVFVIIGDEQGLYAYAYTAPVPMLIVQFTPTGWEYYGFKRADRGAPEKISGNDPSVRDLAVAVSVILAVVENACADTKHVVSYTLNRAERRSVLREIDAPMLNAVLIHHVCLDGRSKASFTAKRGATVVPTPKRLHEVRAHWRHLASGRVVRVRCHTRGTLGTSLAPRVYTVSPSPESSGVASLSSTRGES